MTLGQEVRKIRDTLLPATLEQVTSQSPFYAGILGERWRQVKSVDDLPLLPVVTKEQIMANYEQALCGPRPDDLLSFTSGTTTGKPFVIRRSLDEIQQLRECIAMVAGEARAGGERKPLILQLVDTYHGLPLSLYQAGNVLAVPAQYTEKTHFEWLHQLLASTFDYPGAESRISILRGSYYAVLYLTLYFVQCGIRPARFGVRDLATADFYVTRAWRKFIEGQWEARLVDSYSMSEFAGNPAVVCEVCGYQHFVLPTLVPEVVHPETHEPVESGAGVLVLTGLYPFTQRQPFVRYWTGDLVERGPRCPVDDVGFRIKGRLRHSLVVTEGQRVLPLLTSLDVFDVLDELPDIYRPQAHAIRLGPPFLDPELARMVTTSMPARYTMQRLDDGKYRLELEVGLDYHPARFPDRAEAVADEIVAQLGQRNPTLSQLLTSGDAVLEVQLRSPSDSPPFMVLG